MNAERNAASSTRIATPTPKQLLTSAELIHDISELLHEADRSKTRTAAEEATDATFKAQALSMLADNRQ